MAAPEEMVALLAQLLESRRKQESEDRDGGETAQRNEAADMPLIKSLKHNESAGIASDVAAI